MVDNQFIKAVEYLKNVGIITSQKELSEILGYKQQAFTEIMQGRSKVSTSLIQDFCKKYNISLDWLFYNEGEMLVDIDSSTNNIVNSGNVNHGNSNINGDITLNAHAEHNTLIHEVGFLRGEIMEKNKQLEKKDSQISFLENLINKLKP